VLLVLGIIVASSEALTAWKAVVMILLLYIVIIFIHLPKNAFWWF